MTKAPIHHDEIKELLVKLRSPYGPEQWWRSGVEEQAANVIERLLAEPKTVRVEYTAGDGETCFLVRLLVGLIAMIAFGAPWLTLLSDNGLSSVAATVLFVMASYAFGELIEVLVVSLFLRAVKNRNKQDRP